ncbi:MAG: ClbS/DfsB family four-helix bundle protein [Anaerolineae bacterium]
MDDKQQMLTTIRHEFKHWEDLLNSLSEAQVNAPVLEDNWSLKDVMVHLWAWQQRTVARLEGALNNQTPQYPDWPANLDPEQEGQPHELNAWIYKTYHDQPWSTVYQNWRNGFRRFIELTEAIPEPDLLEPNRYPWFDGYPLMLYVKASYEHHDEHHDYLGPQLAKVRQVDGATTA